jgi:DNA polymerase III subunit delta
MAKSRVNLPPISQAEISLKNGTLLPIYYLAGEDSFSIDKCLKLIEEKAKPFLTSEFDKEVFYGDDKSLSEILDAASAFPFGSEKKLLIFREFEKVKDKKNLTSYAASPSEFTILVLIHEGTISNGDSEPYKTLLKAGYIFEAKELKGAQLSSWLISYAEENGKILTRENAQLLVDISGEDRNLLEAQMEKIFTFLADKKEIDIEAIRNLSTALKEYTIFDLQNAIGKKNKSAAVKVANNLLEKGAEPTFIIFMLTKYFTALSRIRELQSKKIPDQTAARIVGTHPYYYKDYLNARKIYSDKNLLNAASALLKADLSVKTTSADSKTIILLLIAEILQS